MSNYSQKKRFDGVNSSITFRNICDSFGLHDRAVLDVGCGYGHYLKHFGLGSVGVTTAKDEVDFGKENNLNIIFGNAENLSDTLGDRNFDVFWANNIFEHLLSPHSFLIKLKRQAANNSLLILGVPVVPKIVSLIKLNKFRGVLASNHINFFTKDTLRLTVFFAGWSVKDVRPFVFKNKFLDKIVSPLWPHLYIIAENDINFRYPQKKIHEWQDDEKYKELLSIVEHE